MSRTQTAQRAQTQTPPQQAPAGNLPATTNGEQKPPHPITVLKGQLEARETEFSFALPEHMPVQRFTRVILTAVQHNPKMLECERTSLFNAALKAAQDGLLPDGREGAIVDYKDNKTGKMLAQWMPMYQGLLKKVRNSGEFKWMTAQVVYEGDDFDHWIDQDGEHFNHKPAGISERPIRVYSAVTTKSGGAFVEVMTMPQVAKVRAASRVRSEYGPWAKWFDEMAKKTAFRRLAKRLPLSSDLDDLIRRDDALYDFEGQREEAQIARQETRRLTTTQAFDQFAGPAIDHDPATGEVIDQDFGSNAGQDDFGTGEDFDQRDQNEREEAARAAAAKAEADKAEAAKLEAQRIDAAKAAEAKRVAAEKAVADKAAAEKAATEKAAAEAKAKPDPISSGPTGGASDGKVIDQQGNVLNDDGRVDPGVDAQDRRWPNGATPSNQDEYESYAETKIADFTAAADVAPWWKSKEEIQLRKGCNVPEDMFRRLLAKAQGRVAELSKK